jgi:hypothetical protein
MMSVMKQRCGGKLWTLSEHRVYTKLELVYLLRRKESGLETICVTTGAQKMYEVEQLEEELEKLMEENFQLCEQLGAAKNDVIKTLRMMTFWQRLFYLFLGQMYLDRMITKYGSSLDEPRTSGDKGGSGFVRATVDIKTKKKVPDAFWDGMFQEEKEIKGGVLRLTMDDIQPGILFSCASLRHMKGFKLSAAKANKVILEHKGKERILKDRDLNN